MRRALAVLPLVGCVPGPGAQGAHLGADFDAFVARAQPVLQAGCSHGACHGSGARPLEIFGFDHRVDADTSGPVTEEELWLNYQSASAFLWDVDDPEESLLLRKPLPLSGGGVGHEGGPVFPSPDDARYQELLGWARTAFDGEVR